MPPTQFILSDKFRDVGSGDARYSPLQGAAVAFGDNRAHGGKGRLRRPWDPGARGASEVIPKLFRMESNSEWNVISIGKRCREQTSSGANTNDEQFLEMMCQGLVLSGLSQLIV